MEVTKSNFAEVLSKFTSLLDQTEVIAFDLEMSGINGDKGYPSDFPFEYYKKNHIAANKYQIIQIGFCLFSRNESGVSSAKPQFRAFPFSFYIFPKTVNGKMNIDLTMELGSVEFNVNAGGVDWNKWICQGVPYFDCHGLRVAQDICLRDKFAVKADYTYNLYNEEQEEAFQELRDKLFFWYSMEQNSLERVEDAVDPLKAEELCQKNICFEIDSKSFNVIMKLKQLGQKKWSDVEFLTFKKSDKRSVVRAFKVNPERREALRGLHRQYLMADFDKLKGFSLLWEKLKQALEQKKIPMVGHNSLGDVLFMMSHLEGRLRPDYVQFKRDVKRVFAGGLYDTKNLARHLETNANHFSLGELYKHLTENKEPIVTVAEGFEFKENVFHNAGYDAYVTGTSFLHLSNMIPQQKITLDRFKVKMFRIHDFMMDFGQEGRDQINATQGWAVVLNNKYVSTLKKGSEKNQMNDLINEFSRLYQDKKKKKKFHKKSDFAKYDIDVFFAFADALKKMVRKHFKSNDIRVFTNPHLSCFGDVYIVTMSISSLSMVQNFKKQLKDFGKLITLQDAYQIYFEIYNKIYRKV